METRVTRGGATTTRLLIISRGAKAVNDASQRMMDAAFPKYARVDFDPRYDFGTVTDDATVLVAGGDGTVGVVARALAGSRRRLGILPLGTFNNFASALAIPSALDEAIAVIRKGATRPVTLGRINGNYFLEAAAIGIFGDAIVLGEKVKERAFGDLARELGALLNAEFFSFETRGAFAAHGRSRSLVFTNTPTTGARLHVGDTDPKDPFLELSFKVGASRADLVSRVVASAAGGSAQDVEGLTLQFHSLTISTKPRIGVIADSKRIGRTPVTVEAVPAALRVIVPR